MKRCKPFRFHRWSRWKVHEYYTDISWGDRVRSTSMISRCERCGAVKTKHFYGEVILDAG